MILERGASRLYYEVHGPAGAGVPTVLFLNGFAAGISTWYPIIRDLKQRMRCVLYDYIGTGESTNAGDYVFSLDGYMADLLALLDAVDAARVHLVGYSMGGWIAQHLSVRRPDRIAGLVLVNSSSKIFARQHWIISHFIDVLRDSDIETFSKLMFISYYSPEYFEKNEANLERIKNLATLTFNKQGRDNWRRVLQSCLGFDAEAGLADTGFNLPVLLVSGSHDFLCPPLTAQRFDALLPSVRRIELPMTGHAIPMERHQELRAIVEGFLQALRAVEFAPPPVAGAAMQPV